MARKKVKIRKNSYYKKAILEIMSVCGEMTPRAIRMISGNDGKRYKALREMIAYGWLDKDKTTVQIKYERGTSKEERTRYVLRNVEKGYEEYGKYVKVSKEDFENIRKELDHGNGTFHQRALRLSEILPLAHNNNIEFVNLPKIEQIEPGQKYFYTSRDVKRAFFEKEKDELVKLIGAEGSEISYSRLLRDGSFVFIFENGFYMIFKSI